MIDRDLVRDKLSSDNRALWEKLQYRFRNYLTVDLIKEIDKPSDEFNKLASTLISQYKKYKPIRRKTK